jgi:hypothetical protein
MLCLLSRDAVGMKRLHDESAKTKIPRLGRQPRVSLQIVACELSSAQIFSGGLAGTTVCDDVERYLLAFIQALHASAFNGADMNEDVLTAVLWLNEAETFLAVKPLHGSRMHEDQFLE